jgi:hypothetical protein
MRSSGSLPTNTHAHATRAVQGVAALFALCLLSGDASAQDSATFCGNLGRVTIAPSGDDYTVTITNPYCNGGQWADLLDVIPVEIDGLRVVVQLWSAPGNAPDTAVILPPDGWISVPPEITLREFETGSVVLIPQALS